MQHLGVNLGGIWSIELGFLIRFLFFLLRKSGLIFRSPVATLPPTPQLAYAMWSRYTNRAMPLFIRLNPRSCNTSKHLS